MKVSHRQRNVFWYSMYTYVGLRECRSRSANESVEGTFLVSVNGDIGPNGAIGAIGSIDANGAKGAKGANGANGDEAKGARGARGAKGAKGSIAKRNQKLKEKIIQN